MCNVCPLQVLDFESTVKHLKSMFHTVAFPASALKRSDAHMARISSSMTEASWSFAAGADEKTRPAIVAKSVPDKHSSPQAGNSAFSGGLQSFI